jgi:2-octaprenyl-6-methoxyphenol hydroxylase
LTTINHNYDIVIAGGGMVGASLACALGSTPLRVAMVEPVPFRDGEQPSFDTRTLALSRSSQRILSSLGLWDVIGPDACGIRRIHISEQGRFGNALIDGEEQGVGELGYVVESRVLGGALWGALADYSNLQVYSPARLVSAECREDRIHATLESDDFNGELTARLLVVADGARSKLRQTMGIEATTRPYGQTAIIGNVQVTGNKAELTAYERFTSNGPMALLPMGGDRYVFVLTRRTDLAPAALDLSDDAFLVLLQKTFGFRLGRFKRVGTRVSYPLALVRADHVTGERTAIVGNAANGLHPVAGQGYNLSLRDVATLAELIVDDHIRPDRDPGGTAVLDAYIKWRQRDQRNVVAFTDGLIRLFDLPLDSIGIARGLGLMAFDVMPGAKRTLAHHTMGLGGTLTRLTRGLPL